MTLTVDQLLILADSGALQRLLDQPLPVSAAWRLMRLAKKLAPEIAAAQQSRGKFFTAENSVPVFSQPGCRQILPEFLEAYRAEIQPLLEEKVTVDAARMKQSSIASATLTAIQMSALEPLIEEEEEEPRVQ